MGQIDETSLRLSFQVAHQQYVVPKVRAIAVEDRDNTLYLYFFHEGVLSEDEEDLCECIATEMIADFWQDKNLVATQKFRVDPPLPVKPQGILVYQRCEGDGQTAVQNGFN